MNEFADLHGNEIGTLLAPMAVTLITSRFTDETESAQRDRVATIAWVMPISHEPSMIAVAIRPAGSTARAMAQSGQFVVNVLGASEDAQRIALVCGKKSGVEDRFAEAHITAASARKVDVPRIEEAVSWIECETLEHTVYGDHELFIGRTLCAYTKGALDEAGKLAPLPVLIMGERSSFGHFEKGFE